MKASNSVFLKKFSVSIEWKLGESGGARGFQHRLIASWVVEKIDIVDIVVVIVVECRCLPVHTQTLIHIAFVIFQLPDYSRTDTYH